MQNYVAQSKKGRPLATPALLKDLKAQEDEKSYIPITKPNINRVVEYLIAKKKPITLNNVRTIISSKRNYEKASKKVGELRKTGYKKVVENESERRQTENKSIRDGIEYGEKLWKNRPKVLNKKRELLPTYDIGKIKRKEVEGDKGIFNVLINTPELLLEGVRLTPPNRIVLLRVNKTTILNNMIDIGNYLYTLSNKRPSETEAPLRAFLPSQRPSTRSVAPSTVPVEPSTEDLGKIYKDESVIKKGIYKINWTLTKYEKSGKEGRLEDELKTFTIPADSISDAKQKWLQFVRTVYKNSAYGQNFYESSRITNISLGISGEGLGSLKTSKMFGGSKIVKYSLYDAEEKTDTHNIGCVISYLYDIFKTKKVKSELKDKEKLKNWFIDNRGLSLNSEGKLGVSPQDVDAFCEYYNLSHYCLDTQGALIYAEKRNHKNPSLHYITNGSHLYAITNIQYKRAISFRDTDIRFKEEKEKKVGEAETEKKVGDKTFEILGDIDYERFQTLKRDKTYYIARPDINDFFLDYINKSITIPRDFKLDKNGLVVAFSVKSVNLVAYTDIETTIEICKRLKIDFTGQSLTTILKPFFKSLFNNPSTLNSQVYHAISKTFRGGLAFSKKPKTQNLIGYDFNKQYPSILCDKEFCIPTLNCLQNFITYTNEPIVETDLYYVKDARILENPFTGVIFGFIVEAIGATPLFHLKTEVVKIDLETPVISIFTTLEEQHAKKCLNTLIGNLGIVKDRKCHKIFTDTLLNAYHYHLRYSNPDEKDEISIITQSLVKDMSLDEKTEISEPLHNINLYATERYLKKPLYRTNVLAHLYIVQKGWYMTMCLRNRLGGQLVKVATDAVIVENGTTIPLDMARQESTKWSLDIGFGKKVLDTLSIGTLKPIPLEECRKKCRGSFKMIADTIYPDDIKEFREIQPTPKAIFEGNGCYIRGMAGTGKTHFLKTLIEYLKENKITTHVMAPTNCAKSLLVDASTLHKGFRLNSTQNIDTGCLGKFRYNDWIIVDEVSMVSQKFYNLFQRLKAKGCRFVFVGDENQLPPVKSKNLEEITETYAFRDLVNYNIITLTKNMRSEKRLFKIMKNVIEKRDFIPYLQNFKTINKNQIDYNLEDTHIVNNNEHSRHPINKKILEKFEKYAKENDTPLRFVCVKGWKKYNFFNGQKLQLSLNDPLLEDEAFSKHINMAYALTCHKAQGQTIQGNIYIHNTRSSHVDWRWFYTAISRATSIENVWIVL